MSRSQAPRLADRGLLPEIGADMHSLLHWLDKTGLTHFAEIFDSGSGTLECASNHCFMAPVLTGQVQANSFRPMGQAGGQARSSAQYVGHGGEHEFAWR
jgi:hypothetical protein